MTAFRDPYTVADWQRMAAHSRYIAAKPWTKARAPKSQRQGIPVLGAESPAHQST